MDLQGLFSAVLSWVKLVGAHHCPSLDAVFHHEVFCHRGGNLCHVMPVLLFTEVQSAVAEDC